MPNVKINFWNLRKLGRARLGWFDRCGKFHEVEGPLNREDAIKAADLLDLCEEIEAQNDR